MHKRTWRSKLLLYVFVGIAIAAFCAVALIGVIVVRALDTDQDLSDFETPEQARTFTSAHLPAPLPNDAVVETLHYERWTDWSFDARVRLSSAAAVDRYLEEARRLRSLNDEYCLHSEPSDGARYFFKAGVACGTVRRTAAQVLEVHCNTR
ncbi:MAG: hypothetical protein QM756_21310 [Polyangiaceae bacterium]